jgi:general secretion pathway protein D
LILPILSVCMAGLLIPANAQNGGDEAPDSGSGPPMPPPGMPDSGASDQATPGQPRANVPSGAIRFVQPNGAASQAQSTAVQTPSAFTPPDDSGGVANPDQLRLNFDNVPLDMVLNYLSDAAGFIIVMNTQVHGNVSVISSHPMTRDEAVDLLNSVLNQNGYAAIRNGRTLTIMDKSAAKSGDIPVQIGNNPASIPRNDVIVTQIIPVRYVDASQLVSDLSSFVSPEATIVANQAGNSIVITDTQQNIHHLVEIISAIDQSAAGETEIQVFPLRYANPNDVASELGQIFPSGNPTGAGNSPIRFGGFPGGGFGGGGGFFGRMMAAAAANNGGSSSSDGNRAQKQSQVTAVADARTQSIIVMASKDLMVEISGMMQSLDVPSTRDQGIYSYTLHNADPQEVAQVLQTMFQSSTSGRSGSQSSSQQPETSALMNREAQNATTVSTTSSTISSGTGSGIGRGVSGGGGSAP